MKKIFLFFFIWALTIDASAQNNEYYDFSAVCESGQTLYYSIVSDSEVGVNWPSHLWEGYSKPTGDLIIPETVEYEGITYTTVSILNYAFYDCNELTSVVIPNTVTTIHHFAFRYCTGLLSLTIGSSVASIGAGAFCNCSHLQCIYCNAISLPHYDPSYYYFDLFSGVPSDIPVYVSCFAFERFQSDAQWNRFTNMQGVFVGTPDLEVGCNVIGLGTAEIVSIPNNCDDSTATVRAIPNPGHVFSYWKNGIDMVSFSQEYTFVLDQNTTLIACFDSAPIAYDSIAFPDHVIGQKLNIFDEVTYEYPSDFIYNDNGILRYYRFPGECTSTYTFTKYPNMPYYIYISLGNHPSSEEFIFYYDDFDKITHSEDVWSDVYDNAYYDYYYDDNHKLIKKEYSGDDGIFKRYIYSYENGNRTRIDSVFNAGYNTFILNQIITNHYNARQQALTVQTDSYNGSGEITASSLKTYSYTAHHKTDSIITQNFNNGIWVNSAIAHYVYDDINRIVEYQTGAWVADSNAWNITKKVLYDFDDDEQALTVTFRKKDAEGEWGRDVFNGQTIFYDSKLYEWQRALRYYKNYSVNQLVFDLHYMSIEASFPRLSEWYYEIEWDNGDITYQHLEYAADTTIGSSRPKIIVCSNTQYDKDGVSEVTHEYILEESNRVYWWNKDLEEYTTLYDYNAETGDEWEIKVGMESIIVHVDSLGVFEYDGETRKMLHISDAGNIFNGDIVVGYGHMTSFFPERLMHRDGGYTVDGLRCYWVEDALLYHNGEEDCDAIYSEIHGVEEDDPSTPSTSSGTEGALVVYPNPANNMLFVETVCTPSLPDPTYRITNLVGQTLISGHVETRRATFLQIDISSLPAGMYFINMGGQTVKFVVR